MISVEQAQRLISEKMPRWGTANSKIYLPRLALTAEALVADREYPPFHRVMMDGIAVSFEVFQSGQRSFRIEGVSAAGSPEAKLERQDACREVMTGVPLPVGADLVIQYEHLKISEGVAEVIVDEERSRMENVHERGSDCSAGETLLLPGQRLQGPHWGIAASLGYATVRSERKPRINVISTGDELVAVSEKVASHQIRRSNAHALQASLLGHGFEEVVLSHLDDVPEAIESHYRSASREFDLLMYSGGVSKGKFDYLPSVWKKCGVTEHFHGVKQRPGKPLWFGVDENTSTAVLGLPGNPVSSLVCLHRYFLTNRPIHARLASEVTFKKDLTFFLPAKLRFESDGVLWAEPLAIQNSGEFAALAESDGFLELPRELSVFARGEAYRFHPWERM